MQSMAAEEGWPGGRADERIPVTRSADDRRGFPGRLNDRKDADVRGPRCAGKFAGENFSY